jgi:signal transduction histidine kinase
VRIEGYSLELAASGIAQRVFTSGAPAVAAVAEDGTAEAFLAELDARHVAAVPLQIESRVIGVLIAADRDHGEFTDRDVALLDSLAGPSALVLNQMARYEEATEEGAKMAEVAQLKTDFVSVVSHELRTPLTSIIGSLKTLQRPELSPVHPNAIELLTTAERQAQRLRALIEDLLVVSRLDNQALPVRPETVDVPEFLAETVRDIPGARPVVSVLVDRGAEELRIDPEHLRRVIRNIVENALKYAPGSRVDVTVSRKGTELVISIADHGPGIPYDLHDHIFDRFTQVDRHETRGAGGTGLGLSIVRGLVEAMGGRVWFEPTEAGGATFNIAVPARAGTRASRVDR